MAVDILKREIDQMGVRVDRNRVRVRHRKRAYDDQGLPVLAKDSHVAGFCRDIQLLESGIEREHVRVFSDWVGGQNLHVCQIDQRQLIVFLSRDKGQPSAHIEGNPVGTLDSSDWIVPDNLGSSRINRYEFVLLMHRHEDVAGARVIKPRPSTDTIVQLFKSLPSALKSEPCLRRGQRIWRADRRLTEQLPSL
jgi:hypothetical protein